MKIIRDGKGIELTEEELDNAYRERQRLYDIDNIKNNIKYYFNYAECEALESNKNFIELAVEGLEKSRNEHGIEFRNAIKNAFFRL